MINKIFVIIFILFFAWQVKGFGETKELVVLYTNDRHGEMFPVKGQGGLAPLATFVKGVRDESKKKDAEVWLFDAGDVFHGSPEGNKFKGKPLIEAMNMLGYDAMTIGNHEFAFGKENLEELRKSARFPFLACNIKEEGSNQNPGFTKPYIIKEVYGIKVGIIGVITPETKYINFPKDVEGLEFTEPVPAVYETIQKLKEEKVKLFFLVSHLGSEEDERLLKNVPDVDIIFGGHDHRIIESEKRKGKSNRLIFQAGWGGRFAGELHLFLDADKGKIVDFENHLVELKEKLYAPDKEMDFLVERYRLQEMDRVAGQSNEPFTKGRYQESALGNLIADAIREAANVEIAFESSGGIREGLDAGELTFRELYRTAPFDDRIVTLKMTGRQIKDMLERRIDKRGIHLALSGVNLVYDPNREEGSRVAGASMGTEPLNMDKYYTVATSDFVAFAHPRFGLMDLPQKKEITDLTVYSALVKYVENHSPLSHGESGRLICKLKPQEKTGKIDLNIATESELISLPGIGPAYAKRIIEYRENYGGFEKKDDILKIKGIGPKTYAGLKDMVEVKKVEKEFSYNR